MVLASPQNKKNKTMINFVAKKHLFNSPKDA